MIQTSADTTQSTSTTTGGEVFMGGVGIAKNLNIGGAFTGLKPIISGSGATVALTQAQSGSTVLFDRAAGIVFTLPTPAVGIWYDFIVTVTRTSNAHEIDTSAGTVFILGILEMARQSDGSSLNVFGNGTSHVKIASNGTTTGGVIGSQFRLTCVSSTVWQVSGIMQTIGAQSTPFA